MNSTVCDSKVSVKFDNNVETAWERIIHFLCKNFYVFLDKSRLDYIFEGSICNI